MVAVSLVCRALSVVRGALLLVALAQVSPLVYPLALVPVVQAWLPVWVLRLLLPVAAVDSAVFCLLSPLV